MTTPSVPCGPVTPSVPSVRRKVCSVKIKLLWKLIVLKIRYVKAAEHYEKSVELLRRKKALAKLLKCNAEPAVIDPLIAASGNSAEPISNMESVTPNVCITNPMIWVRNSTPAIGNETRKIVTVRRTKHSPYSLDKRPVWTKKDDHKM